MNKFIISSVAAGFIFKFYRTCFPGLFSFTNYEKLMGPRSIPGKLRANEPRSVGRLKTRQFLKNKANRCDQQARFSIDSMKVLACC